jgi:light-regulated signal transduction histidine kinase (bacteriophytochrome)
LYSARLCSSMRLNSARAEYKNADELSTQLQQRSHAAQLEAAMVAAKAARSRLIRVFMHDIRTPLLVASTSLEELLEVLESEEQLDLIGAKGQMDLLKVSFSSVQRIVDDMIDLQVVEARQVDIEMTTWKLSDLASEIWDACKLWAESSGVRLRIGPLDPRVASTVVVGDLARLAQCVEHGAAPAAACTCPIRPTRVYILYALLMSHGLVFYRRHQRDPGVATRARGKRRCQPRHGDGQRAALGLPHGHA